MSRLSKIALILSALVGVAILIGGLLPSSLGQGPIRRDGPLLHAVSFALFVIPAVAAKPNHWLVIAAGASLFGLGIEGLQSFTDRAPELADIAANCAGIAVGVVVGLVLSNVYRRARTGT